VIGGTTPCEPGTMPEPDTPPGAVGETWVTGGGGGTGFGVGELNVGVVGGTGLTNCARAWPIVKAAAIPASTTPAKNAGAGRFNPVAVIIVSLSSTAPS
jgi:hypothetical protein